MHLRVHCIVFVVLHEIILIVKRLIRVAVNDYYSDESCINLLLLFLT